MSYLIIDHDITANKSHSHPASVKAHEKVKLTKTAIWAKTIDYGMSVSNFTSKELCRHLGFGDSLHFVSGRITELKKAGMIAETKEPEREGCTVLVITRFA